MSAGYPRISAANKPALLDALYDRLVDLAERGAPCPSSERLGHAIGVAPNSADWLLRLLVAEGRIAIRRGTMATGAAVYRYRIVTIVATGRRTATLQARPGEQDAVSSDAAALERAKTFLRSRGPIVYAAAVTQGHAGGDLVVVDNRLLTPAEVIDRARSMGLAEA